jgi:hypothetical protein
MLLKFVEMDERMKFKEQIEEKEIEGQVILIVFYYCYKGFTS